MHIQRQIHAHESTKLNPNHTSYLSYSLQYPQKFPLTAQHFTFPFPAIQKFHHGCFRHILGQNRAPMHQAFLAHCPANVEMQSLQFREKDQV